MYADDVSGWRRRAVNHPLQAAFVISLLLHLLAFGAWQVADKIVFKRRSLVSELKSALDNPRVKLVLEPKTDLTKPPVPEEKPPMPMVFVDVDPSTMSKEPPKDAKYYSAISSKAANPDAKRDTDRPEIDGKQSKIMRTFDASRTVVKPTQVEEPPAPKPVPETPKQLAKAQPKSEPKQTLQPGRTSPLQPAPSPNPNAKGAADTLRPETAPEPPRERPRTIAAAMQQKWMIAGERMKQEGGVRQTGRIALDVKGTPFGGYDAELVAAIQSKWYYLIDQTGTGHNRTGHVVLEFKLHHDGSVSGMNEMESTVGEFLSVLCQKAVLDPAPFRKWPTEMRLLFKQDYREVRFTFYY
jgi:hypothetical protein